VARCIRHGEDQLVLDQLAQRHLLAGDDAVRRTRVGRLGVNLGERGRQDQRFVRVHFERHRFQAALAAQRKRAVDFEPQARPTALVTYPADLVSHFAGVVREHVAQTRKPAQRPDPLLRCAG
jgi:hypothetical protein